jgi:hypothetical protein
VKAHRHSLGHEHDFEPQHGLPEALPAGETLLWQGAPEWRSLAAQVFHVRKIALYFALLLVLRAAFVVADGGGAIAVLKGWAWLLPLAAVALGILLVLARLTALTTAYSITDKRVVMRIGIVLTITYNLPLRRIAAAGLVQRSMDDGDIPLTLAGTDRIALLQLWPHARPWHVSQPQPMLRGLRQAAVAGQILARAWAAAQGQALPPRAVASAAPAGTAHQPMPVFARAA